MAGRSSASKILRKQRGSEGVYNGSILKSRQRTLAKNRKTLGSLRSTYWSDDEDELTSEANKENKSQFFEPNLQPCTPVTLDGQPGTKVVSCRRRTTLFDVSFESFPLQKTPRIKLGRIISKKESDFASTSQDYPIAEIALIPCCDAQLVQCLDELEEGIEAEISFVKEMNRGKRRTARRTVNNISYEIDYIAATKYISGQTFCLLKWNNYPVAESTWEPTSSINAEKARLFFRVRRTAISNILRNLRDDQASYTDVLQAQEDAERPDKKRWSYLEKQFEWNKIAKEAHVGPIYIENWSGKWSGSILTFTYIAHNMYSPLVQEAFDQLEITDQHKKYCLEGCKCTQSRCCCASTRSSSGYSSSTQGHGMRTLLQIPREYFFECGPYCNCNPETCMQRVVQKGRTLPLVVFFEGAKGWGVRTIYKIVKRAFVGEYVGEVITLKEAQEQDRTTTYQWQCEEKIPSLNGETLIIDAGKYGNETRFISHSCDPNLRAIEVYYSKYGLYDPAIAFFALRDIAPGEELTISYWDVDRKKKATKGSSKTKCRCGAKKCYGWMPTTDGPLKK